MSTQQFCPRICPESKSVTRIVAFAGTGKTTTLVKLCESNPGLRFLAVMYNRAVKDEAKKTFPADNVLCYTAHGMAMAKAGFVYSKKLGTNVKVEKAVSNGGPCHHEFFAGPGPARPPR